MAKQSSRKDITTTPGIQAIANPRNEKPDKRAMPHIYMGTACGLPARYKIVDPRKNTKACPMCFHRAVDAAMLRYPEVLIGVSATNGSCEVTSV